MALVHRPPIPPWPHLSFVLAKEIIEKKWHRGFLTATEIEHFESAAETYGCWFEFINTSHGNQSDKSIPERAMTALRVRAMLTEQFLPHIYHSDRPCCCGNRANTTDLDQLYEKARSLQLPETPPDKPNHDSVNQPLMNHVRTSDTAKENDDSPAGDLSTAHATAAMREDIPLYDVFHSLEQDHAAMIELQKLEEFEAQEEMNDEDKQNNDEHSLSILNTGSNFSLKYLLQGIAANRQKINLSDRDIRNLLSDFKPHHRTKWANDDRIGQEELYEACEKVLVDLKNFTEHSAPFLNKVTKREAPDYFDVIKNPMDLGTVTKKLKALQYKSKKEFADDLYLIYENCLAYNTNPQASEYRKHAIAMRRKTDRLLVRVPDITIKDRVEAEAEEFGDDASEDGDEASRLPRKGSGSLRQSPFNDQRDGFEMARSTRERSLTRESSAAPSAADAAQGGSDNESDTMAPNGHVSHKIYGGKHIKESQNIAVDDDEKDEEPDIDPEIEELQSQTWHDYTRKTRAKLNIELEKQYQFPFADRTAITRSALDMERFALIEHSHYKPETVQKLVKCTNDRFTRWAERTGSYISLYDDVDLETSDDETLDAFFSKRITKPSKLEEDSLRTDLFLPEYVVASGIPEVSGPLSERSADNSQWWMTRRPSIDDTSSSKGKTDDEYSDVRLDVYPSVNFPNHGLCRLLDRNIHQLQKVRLIYAKCSAIRNNTPISSISSTLSLGDSLDEPQTKTSVLMSFKDHEEQNPPLIINQDSGLQLVQRTLAKLLAHAGFEGAQTTALNVLSELLVDYLLNVGRTLRCYWDDYGKQMSTDEILMHVLYENGIVDISELEAYINDVERYGNRLEELHRKLESSYQDILSGQTEKSEDEEAMLYEDETFITGSFGEDFGDDYFGFKSLGLDQEYNLDTFSIPPRLWFGGNKEKPTNTKLLSKEPAPKYAPPPPFTPITSEKQVIGLLQPVFQKKLAETPSGHLTEDEYIPNRHRGRPRYPPTNKVLNGRKKPSRENGPGSSPGGPGMSGDSRKTKRKRPPEEIQAIKEEREKKRRQKLEEKAMRAAEKEEKRKLREELKEQERLAKQEAKEKKAQAKKPAASVTPSL
ncbi:hypothetical protein BX666DRAFT_1959745 [Dichotomocladium elegans]|nr:hypothetical protein BX666DRAFT_1959745 [Dichotomocladium elegans]